jgi:thiopeptide-type bacteriocin biosynthesis protein
MPLAEKHGPRSNGASSGVASRLLYRPLDSVLVRAPLLPLESYLALGYHPGAHARIDNATAVGAALTAGGLMPCDPRVRRAIAVASHTLLESLERASPDSGDTTNLSGKLLRYLIRLSTRPTPFGLFAGVALARWGETTDLALADAPPSIRTRLDMAWLLHQVMLLESRPEVRRRLRLVANPTYFIRSGRVYLSLKAPTDAPAPTKIVSLRATNVLRRTLQMAREPIAYQELVDCLLQSTPGATLEKVEKLIGDLCEQTLLLTDLRPPLTTDDPLRYVTERLAAIPAAQDILAPLQSIKEAAAHWDTLPPDEAAASYKKMVARAKTLSQPAPENSRKPLAETPFQVDMALALRGRRLNKIVGEEVARAAQLLLRITPFPHGYSHLDAYRRAFESRYGPNREVPLMEMLDSEFGLGPAHLYGERSHRGLSERQAAQRWQTLLDLACNALLNRSAVLELNEETLQRLESCQPTTASVPLSLDLNVFVAASSAEAIDSGQFQIIIGPNLGAQAAGRNIGRFADLLGPEGQDALKSAAEAEEARYPDRIWAELSYLPEKFRSANVVIRPAVRSYEINLGVSPGVASIGVIPPNELMVGIRNDRFYVRWPAADAEIMACAGHMLNNLHAPPLIRFLMDVSQDGLAHLTSFDWGPASEFPFLPRVKAGRIILSPAQWRIDALSCAREFSFDSEEEFQESLARWCERWRVHRYVHLSSGDNRLLLDLDNTRQAHELGRELRRLENQDALCLQEVLPGLDQTWTEGPGGRFVTEFVVPLTLRAEPTAPSREARAATKLLAEELTKTPLPSPTKPTRQSVSHANNERALRLRPPGSDWLYVKLYCARNLEEDLIAGPLRIFSADVLSSGLAEDWFFVRYSDPEPHVRLRFRGAPACLTRQLLPEVCKWASGLMEEELCAHFSFDTYDRELERYAGPTGLEFAEDIFCADSRAVAQILRLVLNREIDLERHALAVLTIDDLLESLGLDETERLRWSEQHAAARKAVSEDYRAGKELLRALLNDADRVLAERGGKALSEILLERRATLTDSRERLSRLFEAGQAGLPALLSSVVHMHCNRLFGIDHALEQKVLGLLLRTREGLTRPRKDRRPGGERRVSTV